eukprot:scpid100759/ scgid34536/ 
MGKEKNLIVEYLVVPLSKALIPIVLNELGKVGWNEREQKKKLLETVIREQIKSFSSANEQCGKLQAVAEDLSEQARDVSNDANEDGKELWREISSVTPEELRELVNNLPTSGRQSLESGDHRHPLLMYFRRIKDCLDDVQKALTKSKKANREAKKVLGERVVIQEKVHVEIELDRNKAADAEYVEWRWVAGLGLVALFAGVAFMASPATLPVVVTALTSAGQTLNISLATMQFIAGLVSGTSALGAMWEASYRYSCRRTKQGCDERLKEVELKQQQHGEDLRKGLVGCNLSSLERFVIKMKCKLKVLKRSVENDDYDISHVMKKLESFMAVADSYRPTDEDVGQVRS